MSLSLSVLVMSCLLISLVKCLKGHKIVLRGCWLNVFEIVFVIVIVIVFVFVIVFVIVSVITDILELPAFRKCSMWRVF